MSGAVSDELLSRIKRYRHLLAVEVEHLPASTEATAVTIAVSNLREVIQRVPGCADFWRHPFDQEPEAEPSTSSSAVPWPLREAAEHGDKLALALVAVLSNPPDPPGFGEYDTPAPGPQEGATSNE